VNSFFHKNLLIGAAEIVCRVPLVFTIGYLARSVGAADFGNWALILTYQVFVAGAAGLGLSSSLSRFAPSRTPAEAGAYLRYAFVLCLLVAVIAGLLTVGLRRVLGAALGVKPEFYWLLPMAVVMAAGSVADGLLDAFFKARMAVGRQISFIFVRTLIEVAAVLLVFVVLREHLAGPPSWLAGYVCAVVAGKLAIYPWLLSGMLGGSSLPPSDRRRELVRYGLPMVPTLLAVWLVGQSDRLVLSHFATKADLGLYAFAATLASYLVFLGYAVYPLLLPAASQLHDAGERASVQVLFQESQKMFMLLWAAAMTCIALWAGGIILWTGGNGFAGARNTLVILCFAVGLEHLTSIYQYAFHLVKRTDLILWLNFVYAALMVAGLTLAGFTSGIRLAPWAVLASTLIFGVVRYRVALRYVPIPMPGTLIAQAATLAVSTVLLARYAADWNAYVRIAITAIVIVFVADYVLRRKMQLSTRFLPRV
jgi:O-antigen/teichoic acid export membrane protein